ncbi:MAG: TonB-dependent hemoglobin/transferrin/lactoferrin family receptor [Aquimonas sp.]|nr:TonB-dependent hemoglobin/transferrin/lactoferrin family receptor [Aquimonas sp.]
MPRTPLGQAIALALVVSSAARAEAPPLPDTDTDTRALERITVSATLSERALGEVPVAAEVIERERMDRELVRDIRDLVRYEPGVSVTSSAGRFGLGGFRIRGLDGNRVRIEIDGAPVPEAFSIGSFSNANRNFVDLDLLKQVEILRGPGSSLYGSDALGGVVVFTTKDPEDFLDDTRRRHIGFKLGSDSADSGLLGASTLAWGGERWSGMVGLSHRQGREPDNQGDNDAEDGNRTRPNPQDSRSLSLLGKLVFAPDADQRLRLSLDAGEAETRTDVLSGRGTITGFGAPVRVLSLDGDDHQTRMRLALAHAHDAVDSAWADALRWQVYRQDSETTQDTLEQRAALAGGQLGGVITRERQFNFDQRSVGLGFTAFKGFDTGAVSHYLTYGLDIERNRLAQKRDGRARLPNGSVTNVISPDTFPVRDFPLSSTTSIGLYLQNEMSLADGRWLLLPGLRVDRFELEPEDDPLFAARNPGIEPAGIRETSLSPKFGVIRVLDERWSVFGNYARGFRAPPYSDVNLGFTNLQFGYTALPNPDLQPETSDGLELGLRARGEHGYLSVSAYYNRYRDFIESLRSLGRDPQSGLLIFQSQNVGRANIRGVEAKAALSLAAFSPTLERWQLRAAASVQRGRDEINDAALASVDPATAVLGLAWQGERIGTELVGRFVRGRDRLPDVGGQPAFEAPGYGLLDWLTQLRVHEDLSLEVGLFNLTDRRHFESGAVPLLPADSASLDRYTAAGRTLALNLRVQW